MRFIVESTGPGPAQSCAAIYCGFTLAMFIRKIYYFVSNVFWRSEECCFSAVHCHGNECPAAEDIAFITFAEVNVMRAKYCCSEQSKIR